MMQIVFRDKILDEERCSMGSNVPIFLNFDTIFIKLFWESLKTIQSNTFITQEPPGSQNMDVGRSI